jgi:hypothetical protein
MHGDGRGGFAKINSAAGHDGEQKRSFIELVVRMFH